MPLYSSLFDKDMLQIHQCQNYHINVEGVTKKEGNLQIIKNRLIVRQQKQKLNMNYYHYEGQREQYQQQADSGTNTLYKQSLPTIQGLSSGIQQQDQKKIWNAFPFTKLYIRMGQWTIQQDFKLLYLYSKHFIRRIKWKLIQKQFGSIQRSKSAIKNRLTLILQKLREKFQKYRNKKDITIIREYLQDLNRLGYRITEETEEITKNNANNNNNDETNYTFAQKNKYVEQKTKYKKNKKSYQEQPYQEYNYVYDNSCNQLSIQNQRKKQGILQQQSNIHQRMLQHLKVVADLIQMAQYVTKSKQNL